MTQLELVQGQKTMATAAGYSISLVVALGTIRAEANEIALDSAISTRGLPKIYND